MTRILILLASSLLFAGCMTHETRPLPRINAIQAAVEIPENQLLDVAVHLFDENVPEDEEKQAKKRIFPEVRKAEARYFSMQARNTLEGSGHWGQVRVIPSTEDTLDVQVRGKIIESSGSVLKLDVTVADATGKLWFRKEYEQAADTRAYKDNGGPRDPFQNLYSNLANDMLTYRQALQVADLQNIRNVSELRFASELAPYAFKDYLTQENGKGLYKVARLPADGDPLLVRTDRIRERDYALLDTINEYYSLFSENMSTPYTNWRRYSYAEIEAEDEAKRSALTRKLLGAAAVVGGLVAGSQSNTYIGNAAATAAVFGGAFAIKSGFDRGAEVKLRADSLKQLGESFQAEVQPLVVEVEGRTLQIKGTAEEQYVEWRRLLKELYESETGLPAAVPAPASPEASGAAQPKAKGSR